MNGSVAVVVLAAGGSTRLGQPKQLVVWRGRTLVEHAVDAALDAACGPVYVALGAHGVAIERVLGDRPLQTLHPPNWPDGLGSTIAASVSALRASLIPPRAILLCLADQPMLRGAHLDALVRAWHADQTPIVCSTYGATRGVPALFDASVHDELIALSGDRGARRVIACDPARVQAIPFPGGELDVDIPDDLAVLAAAERPIPLQ